MPLQKTKINLIYFKMMKKLKINKIINQLIIVLTLSIFLGSCNFFNKSNHLFPIQNGAKIGYINQKGDIVIQAQLLIFFSTKIKNLLRFDHYLCYNFVNRAI
jgi:hypothetical protein